MIILRLKKRVFRRDIGEVSEKRSEIKRSLYVGNILFLANFFIAVDFLYRVVRGDKNGCRGDALNRGN